MTTSRQVVDDLLRGRKAERVAVMDSPWADSIMEWVKQGYPTEKVYHDIGEHYWDPADGRWYDVETPGEYTQPVSVWQHFQYDMVGVGGWFDWLPLRGYNELVEETDAWSVHRNGAGAALKYWKHKSGTPEHIDFTMTSRAIWEEKYRPYLVEFDPERVNLESARKGYRDTRQAEVWNHFGHQFIWENMRQSMGDVTMYESLIVDPDWIHDYNRVYTDMYIRYFTYLFEQVGLPDGIWLYEDMGYKNGLFASPKVLGEIVFPYYKEINDFFHSYDLPVVLHTCGSTAQAIPLIIEAGFDAINPMERKALNNDPFVFAEKYGDKLAFVGGLDARVFESNDREIIKKEVSSYIDGMKARGARLVFASDHSISPNTHYDSYLYALQVYREHMYY
ncbi:MAG: uroporphyrinogen decarboxylase family protein [Anaerolineae bacterium]